jgi:hypothetical protein
MALSCFVQGSSQDLVLNSLDAASVALILEAGKNTRSNTLFTQI